MTLRAFFRKFKALSPSPTSVFLADCVFSLILSAALGYLVGSVPFAYLVVRRESGTDIRTAGSGNVGTLNSYVVTRSKRVALEVLLLDVCKGGASVLLTWLLVRGDFPHGAVAGCAAVLGHSYPVWLAFRGGRGLAPAVGVCLALCWIVVPVWLVLWGGGYLLVRSVNPASAIASLLVMAGALVIPSGWWSWAAQGGGPEVWLRGSVVVLMAIILTRLLEPVREFFRRGAS